MDLLTMKNTELDIAIFLEEWLAYSQDLHSFCDIYDALENQGTDVFTILSTIKKKYEIDSDKLFASSYKLRNKLFLLGEEELNIGPTYHWNQLKIEFPYIKDINFITPFSFTIYWHSIPQLIHLYKEKGLREALFVAHDFIENLVFKYTESLGKFRKY